MSSASLAVRFPNGDIRYGVYNGTSDLARPALHETPEEAWEHRHDPWPQLAIEEAASEAEPVEVATNYGNGFWWTGSMATRELITSGYSPFDEAEEEHDGLPDWLAHWRED